MSASDIDIADLLADDDEEDKYTDRFTEITSMPTSRPVTPVYTGNDPFAMESLAHSIKLKSPNKVRKRPSTAKPKRSRKAGSKKHKMRSRPQSAIRSGNPASNCRTSNSKTLQNAIKRFEALQKTQLQNEKMKKLKTAKYNPKQWFDSSLLKGVDDWREENLKLRSSVRDFKKENLKLKSQIKLLEKQDGKRAKEIQALITVALQNTTESESKGIKKRKIKFKGNTQN